jgi:hypothetical protein
MSQDIEIQNEENNEIENLKKEYEEQLKVAVANYKKASAKLEFAFDSYEEICINKLSSLRVKYLISV